MSGQGRRLLVLAYASSFLIFAVFPSFLVSGESRVLGDTLTDHISHWGSTVLLGLYGADVYRVPTEQLCRPAPEAGSPFINCRPYKHPGIRPVGVNWTDYPRIYPPGFAVLGVAPALLYLFTPVRFDQANLVMILEILVVAHLASLALFVCFWRMMEVGASKAPLGLILFVVMPIIHVQLVISALSGIYDPIAVLAVVLSVMLLARHQPVHALLAMSLGLFFHFRALWQLPLLAVILVQVYRARGEWKSSARARALVVSSGILLLISGVCFLTIMPALNGFRIENRLHVSILDFSSSGFMREWLVFAGLLGALAFQRHWLTLSLVTWQLVMMVQTRQMQSWHPIFMLPIFAAAAHEKKDALQAVSATFLFFILESWQAYGSWVLTGKQLANYVGL